MGDKSQIPAPADHSKVNSARRMGRSTQDLAEDLFDPVKNKKRSKMGKGPKVIIGVSVFLVVAVLGIGIYLLTFKTHLDNSLHNGLPVNDMEALNQTLEKLTNSTAPYYVLVVGSDTRVSGEDSRSDTIMLCRIDPVGKQASILSIPRDIKVQLLGHGTQKINAAMAFDGPAGAVAAVSDFVGVPIAHYIEIDFDGFKDIVNALGGVSVDVPVNTEYDGVSLAPGKQILNGDQALVFVRCRKTYSAGDFQRAANQRQLLAAVGKDILGSAPTAIPGLVSRLSSCVNTDMGATEIIQTALALRGMNTNTNLADGQVPCITATIDGISYDLPVEGKWDSVKQKFIDGTIPFVSDDEKQPNVAG